MSEFTANKTQYTNKKKINIAIVGSIFNEKFTNALVQNAQDELKFSIKSEYFVKTIRVPGAFEIPMIVDRCLKSKKYNFDAVIALGVILKGKTEHADLVANSVTNSLLQLSIKYSKPVIHEVLLLNNITQATERCLGNKINRGKEASQTCLALLSNIDITNLLD